MTIDEAIDILGDNHTTIDSHNDFTEIEECQALDMAIRGLRAWKDVLDKIKNEVDFEVVKTDNDCGLYVRMYDVDELIRKSIQVVENDNN